MPKRTLINSELELLKKRVKENPASDSHLKELGSYYLKHHDYAKAAEQFRLALRFNPRIFSEILLDFEVYLAAQPERLAARFSLIEFYLTSGKIENATLELEELLDLAPEITNAYNLLGQIYLKTERLDECIVLLEKAAKFGIKNITLSEMLAGAYLEKGITHEAINLYQDILNLDPKSKTKLRVLGDLYLRDQKYELAANCFSQMFNDDPEVSAEVQNYLEEMAVQAPRNLAVKTRLAEIYIKCLKPDKAVAVHKDILKLYPQEADKIISDLKHLLQCYPEHHPALKLLAEVLINKGEFSEAVECLEQVRKTGPQEIDEVISAYQKITRLYPDQYLARSCLSEAYASKGLIPECLSELRQVLKLNISEAENIIKKCREILKIEPGSLLAKAVLAQAYFRKEDFRKTIEISEEILRTDKNHLEAYLLLGKSFEKIDLLTKAEEAYRNLIMRDPYTIANHKLLKDCSEKQQDQEINALKKKIKQDPWRVALHFELGKAYYKRGLIGQGIMEFQLALKDSAQAFFCYKFLGQAYNQLGRFDLAEIQFQKILKNIPKKENQLSKEIRNLLGESLEAQGKITEAVKLFEKILAEDIEFENLEKKLKNLNLLNPDAVRNKALICVLKNLDEKEILGFWGKDCRRVSNLKKKNILSVSFGQDHNNQGFEYFLKHKIKSAEEEFNLAIKLDPNLTAALNNLALCYLKNKKNELAESKLKEALTLDPTNPILHNNLGVAYYLRGELEKAEVEFQKTLRVDRSQTPAYLNLGDINYLKQNAKEALGNWKRGKNQDLLSELIEKRLLFTNV